MFAKPSIENACFAFVGPSGCGKDFFAKEFIVSGLAEKLISTATREKRDGEIDGEDYYFITEEQFFEHVKNDDFFEHISYGTNKDSSKKSYYGFYKTELDKLKRTPLIAIVTPAGAEKLKEHIKKVHIIYIKTDEEKRKEHILKRYGDKAHEYVDQINNRILEDSKIFKDYDKEEGVLVINNNYDKDSFIENLKLITSLMFNLEATDKVSKKEIWKEVQDGRQN